MQNVWPRANILKVTAKLKKKLAETGTLETYPAQHCVFRVEQEANGVYLVLKGRVRLSLPDLPKLDRIFSPGSLLGLPATFTGHAFSLEAVAATEREVVHVD